MSPPEHVRRGPGLRLRQALAAELGWLGEAPLWALLGLALLAWLLAYQSTYRLRLAVGGDLATHERRFDEPYLRGFNASEPASDPTSNTEWWQLASKPGAFAYRWAESQAALTLPGLGSGPWLLTLRATSGRQQPVMVQLRQGQQEQPLLVEPGQLRRYALVLPSVPGGDLDLGLESPRLSGGGDASARDLGFVVAGLELRALPTALRLPAATSLSALLLTLLLLYGLPRRLGLARRQVLPWLAALLLFVAWLLAVARLPLTITAATLPWLALACYALGSFGLRLTHRIEPGTGVYARLVLIALLGFGLRMLGLLHPHILFSDIGLNVHNLGGTIQGGLFFSEGLPAEAGGGQAPYPPGQYLTLAPLLLFSGSDEAGMRLAIIVGNALLDSLLALLIGHSLRRAGAGKRATYAGALLYLLPAALLRSFGIGEFANVFGQAMAMIVVLGWFARNEAQASSKHAWLLATTTLLLLALLGHLGVAISLACLLLCLLLAWLAAGEWRSTGWLALAGLLAACLALALYYSAFADLVAARLAAGSATAAPDPSGMLTRLGYRLTRELRPGGVLPPALLLLGTLGLLRYGGLRPGLPSLLSAWWAGTALSLGLLIVARQGVRWEHFWYPGLCVAGGLALGLLARRGRAGRLVAGLLLLALLCSGGQLWYNQVRDYLH